VRGANPPSGLSCRLEFDQWLHCQSSTPSSSRKTYPGLPMRLLRRRSIQAIRASLNIGPPETRAIPRCADASWARIQLGRIPCSIRRTIAGLSCDCMERARLPVAARPYWGTTRASTIMQMLLKGSCVLSGVRRLAVLVGSSWGSIVALAFARRYPALVDSLVLSAPNLARGHLVGESPRHRAQ